MEALGCGGGSRGSKYYECNHLSNSGKWKVIMSALCMNMTGRSYVFLLAVDAMTSHPRHFRHVTEVQGGKRNPSAISNIKDKQQVLTSAHLSRLITLHQYLSRDKSNLEVCISIPTAASVDHNAKQLQDIFTDLSTSARQIQAFFDSFYL